MTTIEFSRAAGRIMNAPYWTEKYAGTDVEGCIRHHTQRQAEKRMLAATCSKIQLAGGTDEDLPASAASIWDRAKETLGSGPALALDNTDWLTSVSDADLEPVTEDLALALEASEWQPYKITRGPRKGAMVWKNQRTGVLRDDQPAARSAKPPVAKKATAKPATDKTPTRAKPAPADGGRPATLAPTGSGGTTKPAPPDKGAATPPAVTLPPAESKALRAALWDAPKVGGGVNVNAAGGNLEKWIRQGFLARNPIMPKVVQLTEAGLKALSPEGSTAPTPTPAPQPAPTPQPAPAPTPQPAPAPQPATLGPGTAMPAATHIDPGAPIGDRLKAYARGDALVKALTDLGKAEREEVSTLRLDLAKMGAPKGPAERAARSALLDKVYAAEDRLSAAKKGPHEALFASVQDPIQWEARVEGRMGDKQKKSHDEGMAFVNRLFQEGFSGPLPVTSVTTQAVPLNKEQRAYCNRDTGIALSISSSAAIQAHEFGHHVEFHVPGALDAALEFVKYRCGDEPPTDLARFGMPGEMGRKDKFDAAMPEANAYYVGKDYGTDASEVLSMGLETLYRDPIGFARKDPEYFKFVMGICDGSLRAAPRRAAPAPAPPPPSDDDAVDLGDLDFGLGGGK